MSQFCLKWNNHVPNLLAVFENLKSMETLVDVTLSCEGRIVKAHKLVLSAGSKFFQNLFLSNPCTHPVIIMHDVKYNILKAIIEFMYRGEISIAQENLETLLKTAKTLDVKGLAEINSDNSNNAPPADAQNTSARPDLSNPVHVQSSGSEQQIRRRRIRSRKRSCDSTYSNEDVIPLKIKDPSSSPEIQDLNDSQDCQIDDESPSFSSALAHQQMPTSERVSGVPVEVNSLIITSPKDVNEVQHMREECDVENINLQEQSNSTSPKLLPRNHEALQNLDTSVTIPSDSLNSNHLLDPNDSEDGEMVDIKPHYLRYYEGAEPPIRDSFTEYLTENDLCTVFQRCRNPSQFAVNVARMLFTPNELRDSNCRGVKDKSALDRQRLQFIRTSVMKFYNILPIYEVDIWKQCMQSIDSRCRHERRPKFRNAVISFGFSDEN